MSSLRPPPSPSPSPSPVQGANGKNASARASMGPAARPSAGTQQGFALASPRPGGGPPSGRPTSELLGSATFQTPEGELSTLFYLFSIVGREDGLWLVGTFLVPDQSIFNHVSESVHCFTPA